MKIKLMICLFHLLLANISYSQINQQVLNRLVDLLNCKSVEFSLKKSPTNGVTAKFHEKCICSNNPDFETIVNAIPSSESKTTSLSQEIETIKNLENNNNLNSKNVLELLSESVFSESDKYPKLYAFAEKRRGKSEFNNFLSSLKNELNQILVANSNNLKSEIANNHPSQATNELTNEDLEERVLALENQVISANSENWYKGSFIRNAILTLILILAIVACTIFIIKRQPYKNIHSNLSKPSEEWVIGKIKELLNDVSAANSIQTKNLFKEVKEIKSGLESLNNPKTEFSKPKFEKQRTRLEESDKAEVSNEGSKQGIDIIYLSGPNLDGSFNASSAQLIYKEGASIYKLQKFNPSRASFQIDEKEQSISLALSYPERTIVPVCESSNPLNSASRKIVTDKPGELELVEDKWVLIRKAKIHYES